MTIGSSPVAKKNVQTVNSGDMRMSQPRNNNAQGYMQVSQPTSGGVPGNVQVVNPGDKRVSQPPYNAQEHMRMFPPSSGAPRNVQVVGPGDM